MNDSTTKLRFIRKTSVILCLLTAFSGAAFGQDLTMSAIPMTWKDFTIRKLSDEHSFTARTYMGRDFHYETSMLGDTMRVTFSATVFQDRKKSTVGKAFMKKSSDSIKTMLLDHEKGHWIIAMLYFKKLETAFKSLNVLPYDRYRYVIDSIRHHNYQELRKEQRLYDNQTRHMRNFTEQTIWQTQLLADLSKAYPNTTKFPMKFTVHFLVVRHSVYR